MVAVKRDLDFELCREVLVRLEGLWESKTPSLPRHYVFENQAVENIAYNIEKPFEARLFVTTTPDERASDQLSIWPTGFAPNGWRFLEAAKDESKWKRALKVVGAQDGPESVRPLKAALLSGG